MRLAKEYRDPLETIARKLQRGYLSPREAQAEITKQIGTVMETIDDIDVRVNMETALYRCAWKLLLEAINSK